MLIAEKEIVYFGLKRSGHHAVIDWHISHAGCDLVFVNNIRLNDRLVDNLSRAISTNNRKAYRIKPAGDWTMQSVLDRRWPLLIYNIEAASSAQIGSFKVFRDRDGDLSAGRARKYVLVLRDPLNNFASIARRRTAFRRSRMRDWVNIWMEHATGFMDASDDLYDVHARLVVRFTDWNLDQAYRKRIAAELNLVGSALPTQVTAQGGGSSFAGLDSDFLADRSVLLRRWNAMLDRPEFFLFFQDPDFVAAAQRYYEQYSYPEEMIHAVEMLHRKAKSYPWLARHLRILRRSWPLIRD